MFPKQRFTGAQPFTTSRLALRVIQDHRYLQQVHILQQNEPSKADLILLRLSNLVGIEQDLACRIK